jgi:hypothetical protein
MCYSTGRSTTWEEGFCCGDKEGVDGAGEFVEE